MQVIFRELQEIRIKEIIDQDSLDAQQLLQGDGQESTQILQANGQQLIWHNGRLYAIVPQGKLRIINYIRKYDK